MKVIWVNRSDWKKPGPIVYMGLLNAQSFADRGLETHYFVSEGNPSDTSDDLDAFYGVKPADSLHIHRVKKGSKLNETFGRLVYRKAIALARHELMQGHRVLFVTRELGIAQGAARLQRRFGDRIRTLYEAHDFHADLTGRETVDFNCRRKRFVERFFLPKLSGILCITEAQEALYRRSFPQAALLARPLGCLEFPAPADSETTRKRRTLTYIGHVHPEKGVPQLTRFGDFLDKRDVRLQIIGASASRAKQLQRKLKTDGARRSIELLPMMPPAALHCHLEKNASLGLVPIQDSFYNRNLTCPVKALDSLAHHLPVIASDLPSTREVIGQAGVYVPPGNTEAALTAAADLLDDPLRYAKLAVAATTRAAELSWEKRAEAILEWIESME